MNSTPNLFDATTRQQLADLYGPRAAQIQRASNSAAELDDTFQARAEGFIAQYAQRHRKFTGEECTAAALAAGIVPPCHGCWGTPMRKAIRRGWIRRIDYLPRVNGNPQPLYGSLVFDERHA